MGRLLLAQAGKADPVITARLYVLLCSRLYMYDIVLLFTLFLHLIILIAAVNLNIYHLSSYVALLLQA